jgi:DNA repair exonuclease SbcCD nuclease subunit
VPKFIHIADVHLDTTFLNRSEEVRRTLRRAIRAAFESAVTEAIEQRVSGVLIAGDLFDGSRLSFSTERFLIEQLFRLHHAAIPCFYATGNHDPGGKTSRLSRMKLPESFVVFDRAKPRVEDIVIDGERVARVVGAGHESPNETRNLAKRFPEAESGVPTIGLLHALVTSASGVDRHDRYAACSIDDLRSKGYAYWALGHVHERQQVDQEGRIQYSGNIQGRTPKEAGPRGGLLVTVDASVVTSEFLPLSSIDWVDVTVDELDEISDAARLERRVRECYEASIASDHTVDDRMVRFILTGPTPLAADFLRAEYLSDVASDLKNGLGVLGVEVTCRDVRPPIEIADYRNGQHLLSEVLDLIDEVGSSDDLIGELAPDPIADVNGSANDRFAYLRELLEGMDAEAAARLLLEED